MRLPWYPYVLAPNRLKQYLQSIPTVGVPDRLTQKTLESHGFKTKNDRRIIGVLKVLGFIREDGVPTQDGWKAYRDKNRAAQVLGRAIRHAYRDLFDTYPDACRRDDEAIRNFMRANTKANDSLLSRMVSTFKTLCQLASFDEPEAGESSVETGANEATDYAASSKVAPAIPLMVPTAQAARSGLTLNINIELHLPATTDGTVYEKLFEAMKTHFLDR